MTEFRHGDLVRIKEGEHAGKVGRVYAIQLSLSGYEHDAHLWVDGARATEYPAKERLQGQSSFSPSQLEHVTKE